MIGLDTNVLVRYFAQDDPDQSAIAVEILEHRLTADEPGFVSVVTVAETICVLQRAYRLSAQALVAILERMLRTSTLFIERETEVFMAMNGLRDGTGEFGDALIGALSTRAGCTRILTFDRRALRLPGFELP